MDDFRTISLKIGKPISGLFSNWLDGDLAECRVIRTLKPRGQNWFSIVTPVLYPGGGMPVMPN